MVHHIKQKILQISNSIGFKGNRHDQIYPIWLYCFSDMGGGRLKDSIEFLFDIILGYFVHKSALKCFTFPNDNFIWDPLRNNKSYLILYEF